MNFHKHDSIRPLLSAAAIAVALSGCGTLDARRDTEAETRAVMNGPQAAPERSITGFSSALRCMDSLLMNYGVRDISVLTEDIVDQTHKVNAGTKDMLISAVSDMTRRSGAIRLVAYGQDSSNLIGFMREADRKSAYAVMPLFDVKGSITQLDENLVRKQIDAGIGFNPLLNLGAAKTASATVLALDLTILSTSDLSVLAGVTSRNSVVMYKEGSGYDSEATIQKLGINFNLSLSKSDGQSQALRTLVELAAVELFGKLTKTPYWTCLGTEADDQAIQSEMTDWYFAMLRHPAELVMYFQYQLQLRGYYRGPLDGYANDALREAVTGYRAALGLSAVPVIDQAFFAAYLKADHAAVLAKAPPPPPAAAAAPAQANAAGAGPANGAAMPPLQLVVSSPEHAATFKRGERISVVVAPNRDAYVYCYWQDETRSIQRFYPNHFSPDALVHAAAPLQLPGGMHFEITANTQGIPETVACFAAERDVMAALPAAVAGTDFRSLAVSSLAQVKDAFVLAAGSAPAEGGFRVEFDSAAPVRAVSESYGPSHSAHRQYTIAKALFSGPAR